MICGKKQFNMLFSLHVIRCPNTIICFPAVAIYVDSSIPHAIVMSPLWYAYGDYSIATAGEQINDDI